MTKGLKGQGTFEYILLLAGVLLVVVLAIVLLRGGIFGGSASNINRDSCKSELALTSYCYYTNYTWNSTSYVPLAYNATVPSCLRINQVFTGLCNGSSLAGYYNATAGFCCGAQP